MKFEKPLVEGTLIKRYKRFLADVTLENGDVVTAHCPNSGSMKTCWEEGWKVILTHHDDPKRKLKYTWEMVHNGKCWIGVNTQWPNRIAFDAIEEGIIPELTGLNSLRKEKKYGKENSRIDIWGETEDQEVFIEIKNVTLVEEDGINYFPDAVTTRGQKHLRELMDVVSEGNRAVMLYVLQRSDGEGFKPASHIDPKYSDLLKEALEAGVEVLAYQAEVSPDGIHLTNKKVEVLL